MSSAASLTAEEKMIRYHSIRGNWDFFNEELLVHIKWNESVGQSIIMLETKKGNTIELYSSDSPETIMNREAKYQEVKE